MNRRIYESFKAFCESSGIPMSNAAEAGALHVMGLNREDAMKPETPSKLRGHKADQIIIDDPQLEAPNA